MAKRELFSSVKIVAPKHRKPDEFTGHTGYISNYEGKYYRVKFDEPVNVPGVGTVKDDLFMSEFLRTSR